MDSELEQAIRLIAADKGVDPGAAVAALAPREKELLAADNWDALEQAVDEVGGDSAGTVTKTSAPAQPGATPASPTGTSGAPAAGGLRFPIAGYGYDPKLITTRFGAKQARSDSYAGNDVPETHAGVDFAVPVGTPIVAPEPGTVVKAATEGAYGNILYFKGDSGTEYRFPHLSKFVAKAGQRVDAGGQLAASGGAKGAPGSGNSTGPHVHIEVRQNGQLVDPEGLLMGAGKTPAMTNDANDQGSGGTPSKVQQQYDDSIAKHTKVADALDAATARRDALQAKLSDGTISSQDAIWLNQTADKDIARLSSDERAAFGQVTTLAKAIQAEGKPVTWLTRSLPRGGIVQVNPLTGEQRVVRDQDSLASMRQARTFQGPNGLEYVLSGDGTSATPVAGVGLPIKTISRPDGSAYVLNGDGSVGTQIFGPEPKTVTAGNRQYPVDPKTGLAIKGQGVDLLTDLERQASDATTKAAAAKAQYEAGRGDLIAKLQPLVDAQAMTGDDAAKQLADYDKLWETPAQRITREYQEAQTAYQKELQQDTRRKAAETQGELALKAISQHALARAQWATGTPGSMVMPAETITPQPGENVGIAILRKYGMWDDSLTQQPGAAPGPAPGAPAPSGSAPGPAAAATPAIPFTPGPLPAIAPAPQAAAPISAPFVVPGAAGAAPTAPSETSQAPGGKQPVPGRDAIDLSQPGAPEYKPGWARTEYADGSHEDWLIPQTTPAGPTQPVGGE